MTDVLDEFDHVLGRSVDTYSDEVDETQANQMIEAAIDQYYIQQDKNGMLLFMEVMVTRMQQAGRSHCSIYHGKSFYVGRTDS